MPTNRFLCNHHIVFQMEPLLLIACLVTRRANRRSLVEDAGTGALVQTNRSPSPDHGHFLPAEETGMVWRMRGGRAARLLRAYHAAEVHLQPISLHQHPLHQERQYGPSWEFAAPDQSHDCCKYFKNSSGLDRKHR